MCKFATFKVIQKDYLSWYGKTGNKLNGTKYSAGHAFSSHIAINN